METKIGNTKLVEYGIQTEDSDWRAHVCVNAQKVYVFPTKLAAPLVDSGNYAHIPVYTWIRGQKIQTATGIAVPALSVPRVVPVGAKYFIEKAHFNEEDSTTIKGEKAVDVVQALLRVGWFPLPWDTSIVSDVEMQRSGLDIVVSGRHRIQVKCDFRGGDPAAQRARRCRAPNASLE